VSLMPFEGLRDFLSLLESQKEISRVRKPVDAISFEISAILERLQTSSGRAVIFENIKDYDIPLCANALGSSRRLAMALETTEEKVFDKWKKCESSQWLAPEIVSSGCCQECVISEQDVNLLKLPIIKWNPLDAGPYITLGALISKDPESHQRNIGIYRLLVQGRDKLVVNFLENRHAMVHYKKAEQKGLPLEVAIAIGLDPVVLLCAAANIKLGEDELALAGALRGQAVNLVHCKSVDVEVPASSEIVIEGEMPPKARALEGPFGESYGYYGKASYKPIMNVKSITHRLNPIYQATYTGKPIREEHYISRLSNCAYKGRKDLGIVDPLLNFLYNTYLKVRLQVTAREIKLPVKDVEKTAHDWPLYSLD
jgi:UbiD family decarboxylase